VLFAEPRGIEAAPALDSSVRATGAAAQRRWRIGEVETNACMLFYRATAEHPLACLGFVDGSLARAAGRRGFDLTLPEVVPAYFYDGTKAERRTTNDEQRTTNHERRTTKDHAPCAASPVS
jgi:hypothetical protein